MSGVLSTRRSSVIRASSVRPASIYALASSCSVSGSSFSAIACSKHFIAQGSCQWYAAAVVENKGNYREVLANVYHKYPTLIPASPFIDKEAPGKVKKLKPVWTADGYILFWTAPKAKDEMDKAVRYVVYRFNNDEKVNLNDPSHIVEITTNTFYKLPYENGKTKYRYVVTALDRLHNESKAVKKKIKL